MIERDTLGPLLERASAALIEAGFGTEAEQIRAAARIPTTSSLEITGAVGMAILRVLANVGHLLPGAARRPLRRSLRIIRRAWPELGREDGREGE